MAKPIVAKVSSKNSIVLYQQTDEAIGEPALLIEYWSDTISIIQEDNCIMINKDTVAKLIDILKNRPV